MEVPVYSSLPAWLFHCSLLSFSIWSNQIAWHHTHSQICARDVHTSCYFCPDCVVSLFCHIQALSYPPFTDAAQLKTHLLVCPVMSMYQLLLRNHSEECRRRQVSLSPPPSCVHDQTGIFCAAISHCLASHQPCFAPLNPHI